MPPPRYTPVPQHDQEAIILSQIQAPSYNYNYNTGIPSSVPSSTAPSVTATTPSHDLSGSSIGGVSPYPAPPSLSSIPTSPPPSFHTHSSPGTPRPAPSHAGTLWGVAPSTIALGEEAESAHTHPTEFCAAGDAPSGVRALQLRVERLEEALGKLLLEKEEWQSAAAAVGGAGAGAGGEERRNCCVTFSEASGDLERDIAMGGRNCCVSFRGKKDFGQRTRRQNVVVVVLILALMVVGIAALTSNRGQCQGKGCDIDIGVGTS